MKDSPEYLQKKNQLRQLLTLYGRKPVLEALQDSTLSCLKLHLADSNKPDGIIREIQQLAENRSIEVVFHNRQALARISKNGKQDQGVCLDIDCHQHKTLDAFLEKHSPERLRLLALDRITNPQNLGMIIRSACAGDIDGILIPDKGCARLDALVIKASAGTLFKAPLLRCDNLPRALSQCQQAGFALVGLSGKGAENLSDFNEPQKAIYILGNETEGVSHEIEKQCQHWVKIPMNNGVESLNVAVTAALLAFRYLLD